MIARIAPDLAARTVVLRHKSGATSRPMSFINGMVKRPKPHPVSINENQASTWSVARQIRQCRLSFAGARGAERPDHQVLVCANAPPRDGQTAVMSTDRSRQSHRQRSAGRCILLPAAHASPRRIKDRLIHTSRRAPFAKYLNFDLLSRIKAIL